MFSTSLMSTASKQTPGYVRENIIISYYYVISYDTSIYYMYRTSGLCRHIIIIKIYLNSSEIDGWICAWLRVEVISFKVKINRNVDFYANISASSVPGKIFTNQRFP